nr:hypothetical protein [uncultured Flavobacterium sp.]
MNPKTKIVLAFFLIIISYQNLLADATPFKRRLIINLDLQNSKNDTIEKVCLLLYPNYKNTDSICGCEGSTCLWLYDKTLSISRHVPEKFKLVFTVGGKQLLSPLLNEYDTGSLIELKITDNEIIETTPFFRVPWNDYFLALFFTLFMELFFACAFFIKHKIKQNNLILIVVCNLITHPLLWLACAYFIGWGFRLFLAEGVVILIEASLFCWLMKPKMDLQKALRLSVIINAASYFLGGILYLIFS